MATPSVVYSDTQEKVHVLSGRGAGHGGRGRGVVLDLLYVRPHPSPNMLKQSSNIPLTTLELLYLGALTLILSWL